MVHELNERNSATHYPDQVTVCGDVVPLRVHCLLTAYHRKFTFLHHASKMN